MSSERGRCGVCGDLTSCWWRGSIAGTGSQIALCGDCVSELLEDFGQEFPEELHDDLPPDDINDLD